MIAALEERISGGWKVNAFSGPAPEIMSIPLVVIAMRRLYRAPAFLVPGVQPQILDICCTLF